jgi:hypothetical protein
MAENSTPTENKCHKWRPHYAFISCTSCKGCRKQVRQCDNTQPALFRETGETTRAVPFILGAARSALLLKANLLCPSSTARTEFKWGRGGSICCKNCSAEWRPQHAELCSTPSGPVSFRLVITDMHVLQNCVARNHICPEMQVTELTSRPASSTT